MNLLNILKYYRNEYCKEMEVLIVESEPLKIRKKKLDNQIKAIEYLISVEENENDSN